ncbi:hypothetical protein ACT7CZ_05940 [Bacillus cereus]
MKKTSKDLKDYKSKVENFDSIILWMMKEYSKGKIDWLRLLEDKNSNLLKKNIKEIHKKNL